MSSRLGKTGSPKFIPPWHVIQLPWQLQHTVNDVICLKIHDFILLFSREAASGSAKGAKLKTETGFEV